MASTILNTTVTFGGTVEFPAAIRKAAEKTDVKFDRALAVTVDGATTYERIVRSEAGAFSGTRAHGTGQVAEPSNIVRGVWNGDDFHPVDQAELDKIVEDTQITGIDIEGFVPLKNLPLYRAEGAYFLAPQKGLLGAKSMRLLRDALKAEKAAGVCKVALKATGGRQKLGTIYEQDGKLILNVLAFADDFRDADESASALDNVEVRRDHLAAARQLIKVSVKPESKLLNEAKDDAVTAREALYADAVSGRKPKAKTSKKQAVKTTDDIMAALEQSIAQAAGVA